MRNYSQMISFYNIEKVDYIHNVLSYIKENIDFNHLTWTVGIIYRLFICLLLPQNVKRCIYFDADIISNMDIIDLWHEEIGENGLSAVPEWEQKRHLLGDESPIWLERDGVLSKEKYCNSGVLLLDKQRFFPTVEMIVDGLHWYTSHPDYIAADQDIINYFYGEECRKLPVRYNDYVNVNRMWNTVSLKEHIYHMSTASYNQYDDCYKKLWFSYYVKTPWFNGEIFLSSIKKALAKEYNLQIYTMCQIIGKNVVFCINDDKFNLFKNSIFAEKVVIITYAVKEKVINLEKCINHMKKNKGENYIYCYFDNFGVISNYLQENGYVLNKEFIDGSILINPYIEYINGNLFK